MLIRHYMVDIHVFRCLDQLIERLAVRTLLKSGEEGPLVINSLDEGVNRVTEGLNSGPNDRTVFIFHLLGFKHRLGSPRNGILVGLAAVLHEEGNIVNSVSVSFERFPEILVSRVQGGDKGEDDVPVSNDVSDVISTSCF